MTENNHRLTEQLLDLTRNRYFGKYRGEVVDNDDPTKRGRLKVREPALLRTETVWAMPCLPYGGKGVGLFMLPEPGAGVWVEFEAGDISSPIWSGCYWTDDELPADSPKNRVIRTETGLTVSLDDQEEIVTISDKSGDNIITIDVFQGKIKVKGSSTVVIEAPNVQLGGEGAAQPVVKGIDLMVYLTQLAAAAMPKVPIAPPLPPSPSILSNTVKTT